MLGRVYGSGRMEAVPNGQNSLGLGPPCQQSCLLQVHFFTSWLPPWRQSSLTWLLDEASFPSSLRDFMDPTMDNTKHILNYLMPIIDQVNPKVHDFMQR